MSGIETIFAASPVMPVLVIERVEDAAPLARALVAGGVPVLEVTLRTRAALAAVRAIRAEVPEAIVGVGTITTAAQLGAAAEAGAAFGVSPGTTPELLAHARRAGLPFLPGAMTPSDVMRALDEGCTRLKFFPAAQAGGIAMLKALAGPFPQALFCPTGGVDAATAPSYLALANVACVGGSWLAPAERVRAGEWEAIRELASTAARLRVPR
ncbi:MAG: bifunctional 4-hydroxy-2-oxoglutarate aldolase/2-dehydro-3-deoxy-phosphogluconate aldolase [Burkholderiales bacterium]|nr:bifunctional 4-hydroxy-2-oxoglutarate aldolase/2-dehydro-3-deoxy-phosphogluconate aldolase [Burkholderiales bacterium]